jgi:hypothetical protein
MSETDAELCSKGTLCHLLQHAAVTAHMWFVCMLHHSQLNGFSLLQGSSFCCLLQLHSCVLRHVQVPPELLVGVTGTPL